LECQQYKSWWAADGVEVAVSKGHGRKLMKMEENNKYRISTSSYGGSLLRLIEIRNFPPIIAIICRSDIVKRILLSWSRVDSID